MSITIVPADLSAQQEVVIDTLFRHLTDQSDQQRFEWLYKAGPHGAGKAWLAMDTQSDAVVGMGSAFSRKFYFEDREISAWVLGDFCLDPQYRSLGPALQLQRACLGVTEWNGETFCYDFPSASMVAVYKRLGIGVNGKMLRLAKPLGVDRKVKQIIKNAAAQRVVTSVGNALLRRVSPKAEADESLEVAVHAQCCGEEFTVLAQQQRGKFGLCLDRSAEYLNWRYISNPLARHEIVTARSNGRLVGYVVWTRCGENASIVDFFGENDSGMVRRLVAEIATLAQDARCNDAKRIAQRVPSLAVVVLQDGIPPARFRSGGDNPVENLPSQNRPAANRLVFDARGSG